MAGSHSQASQPGCGIVALVLLMLQIGVLSAGLVIPFPVVFAKAGNQAASEDHEEGISVFERKRSRSRTFVVSQHLAVVPRQTAVPRDRVESDLQSRLRWPNGHRIVNGLLAPLRC